MSRFRTDGIHLTSPAGVWGYDDLIGAIVRVKSSSVSSGLFSVDSSSEYRIKSVRFRLDIDTGKLVTIIGLDGLDGDQAISIFLFVGFKHNEVPDHVKQCHWI